MSETKSNRTILIVIAAALVIIAAALVLPGLFQAGTQAVQGGGKLASGIGTAVTGEKTLSMDEAKKIASGENSVEPGSAEVVLAWFMLRDGYQESWNARLVTDRKKWFNKLDDKVSCIRITLEDKEYDLYYEVQLLGTQTYHRLSSVFNSSGKHFSPQGGEGDNYSVPQVANF
jgi:hypothetical protein